MTRYLLIILLFLPINFCFSVEKIEEQNNKTVEKVYKTIKTTKADRFQNTAIVKVLNKITGKTQIIKIKINETIVFERLEIKPIICWKSYPEEEPENKLLLEILENNPNNTKKAKVFFGWIFSSSPSISGLEHPLYDIKLDDCINE